MFLLEVKAACEGLTVDEPLAPPCSHTRLSFHCGTL